MNRAVGWARGRPALAIFLLALAVRAGFNLAFSVHEYPQRGDPLDYVTIAGNLLDGNGYATFFADLSVRATARRPPLFPLLLAGSLAPFGRSLLAPLLLLSVIGAGTCVLLFHLARRLLGDREGWVAGVAAALLPGVWINSTTLMSETPYIFLLVAFVLLADRADRESTVGAALPLGALAGLLALTRPEGILLWGILAFWLVAVRRGARRWRAAAATLGLAALVISPWVVRNFVTFGAFVPNATSMGQVLACANNHRTYYEHEWLGGLRLDPVDPARSPRYLRWLSTRSEAEIDRRLARAGLRFAREHARRWPVVVAWRLRRTLDLWHPARSAAHEQDSGRLPSASLAAWFTFPPTLLAATLGAWQLRRRARRLFWPYALIGFYLVDVAVTWGTPRFRSPMEPMLILLAAASVTGRRA